MLPQFRILDVIWFQHVTLAAPKPYSVQSFRCDVVLACESCCSCSLTFPTVHVMCLNLWQIKTTLSDICRKEGVEDNTQAVFNFLINRVRSNVHVVLCMSPVGEDFRFVYMSAVDVFYRVGGVQMNLTSLACGCHGYQGWLTLCFDSFVIASVVSAPASFYTSAPPPPPPSPLLSSKAL